MWWMWGTILLVVAVVAVVVVVVDRRRGPSDGTASLDFTRTNRSGEPYSGEFHGPMYGGGGGDGGG
jgi:hypothetical protein